MFLELRSKREKKRVETKEDIKHLFEKVWDYDPDRTFYKIFVREAREGIQHVIDISKKGLKDLEWVEDNRDRSKLMTSEVCKVLSLKNYVDYLKVKGNLPSNPRDLRHNIVTIDDWEHFRRDPASQRVIESTGVITSDPPQGFSGSS